MNALTVACIILACSGLVLIYIFSPAPADAKSSIAEVRRSCSGAVDLAGTITGLSSSDSGLIAELSENKSKILVFIRDFWVQEGDNISVSGKANKFSNQCWVFADKVEFR
jgi:hypothetical protein